ncbi:MAG: two-component sensor histidine kinase, partial [Comamonadaceae bacterium]
MSVFSPFSRRLYLRIWLAVVGGVAVFAVVVGLAWRMAAQHNEQAQQANSLPPSREFALRDDAGKAVLQGQAVRQPFEPGEPIEYTIEAEDGKKYVLQMAPRSPPGGRGRAA